MPDPERFLELPEVRVTLTSHDVQRCLQNLGLLDLVGSDEIVNAKVAAEKALGELGSPNLGSGLFLRRTFLRHLADCRSAAVRDAVSHIPDGERTRVREALRERMTAEAGSTSTACFDPLAWDLRAELGDCGRHAPLVALGLAAFFLDRQDDGFASAARGLRELLTDR